jgi:hypothetical protein
MPRRSKNKPKPPQRGLLAELRAEARRQEIVLKEDYDENAWSFCDLRIELDSTGRVTKVCSGSSRGHKVWITVRDRLGYEYNRPFQDQD